MERGNSQPRDRQWQADQAKPSRRFRPDEKTHGQHGKQSTRGIIAPEGDRHPILRGIHDGDIWGSTDVYGVRLPLPHGIQPLILGQVLQGMNPTDEPVPGTPNNPMMPIAWVMQTRGEKARPGRVFTTTMGASQDFESEGLRRLLVNACYWAISLESQIPAKTKVGIVGEFHPHPFGFGGFEKGRKPSDFASP